jgi:hypothetical protein
VAAARSIVRVMLFFLFDGVPDRPTRERGPWLSAEPPKRFGSS